MSIAQQLYEGVDITGEGTVGLITYMRTDSLRLSEEAIAAAKGFIETRYGKQYYPPQARHYKTCLLYTSHVHFAYAHRRLLRLYRRRPEDGDCGYRAAGSAGRSAG